MVKDKKEGVVEGKAASKHDPLAKMPQISTQNLSQNLERLKPLLEACVKLGEVLIPLAQKYSAIAFKFYEDYLEQYYSPDLVELTLGCVLLFFGGNFALTIACYTAIRLSGWDTLQNSIGGLWETYTQSRAAINKELSEKLDTDGDGVVSAAEIAKALKKQENVNLLTITLLKAVDPNRLMAAVKGLWMVLVSVMVTLKSQFAQQITIGANVGKVLQDGLEVYFEDDLKSILKNYHPTYAKWSNFIIICFTRLVCISISMLLTRIVAAYHSALKGGDILSKVIIRILTEQELVQKTEYDMNSLRLILQQCIAAYGFYAQFKTAFSLSWWLKIVLAPFVLLESFLTGVSYYAI